MEIDLLLDTLEENMMKTEEALKTAFSALRTGKASPALVENITVDYYGAPTRIREYTSRKPQGFTSMEGKPKDTLV